MLRTLDIHLNVTPERFQFESVPQVPQVPSAAGNVTSNPRGSCDPRMAPGPLRHSRNEHVVHHPTPTPFPIFQIFHMAAPSSSSSGSPKCLGPIPWRPVSSFVCLSKSMQINANHTKSSSNKAKRGAVHHSANFNDGLFQVKCPQLLKVIRTSFRDQCSSC